MIWHILRLREEKNMRFYELLNFQHVILFVLPTLLFIVVFGFGLGFVHFKSRDAEKRKHAIAHGYPDGIEGREAPFPLVMLVIVAATVIWAFFYILFNGLLEVRI